MSVSLDTLRAGDMCLVTTVAGKEITVLIGGKDDEGDWRISANVWGDKTPNWWFTSGYVIHKVMYNLYDVHKKLFREDGTQR